MQITHIFLELIRYINLWMNKHLFSSRLQRRTYDKSWKIIAGKFTRYLLHVIKMGQLMLRGKLDVRRIQGNDARQGESAGRVLPGLSLPRMHLAHVTHNSSIRWSWEFCKRICFHFDDTCDKNVVLHCKNAHFLGDSSLNFICSANSVTRAPKMHNVIVFLIIWRLRDVCYSFAFVGFESNWLSIADSRETESAGGPNVPQVPRGAALSHHTRTDINTWPPRYLQSVDSLSSINYGGKTSATRCALRFAFYSWLDVRCLMFAANPRSFPRFFFSIRFLYSDYEIRDNWIFENYDNIILNKFDIK